MSSARVFCQICGGHSASAVEVVTYRAAAGECQGVLTQCSDPGCGAQSVLVPTRGTVEHMQDRRERAERRVSTGTGRHVFPEAP